MDTAILAPSIAVYQNTDPASCAMKCQAEPHRCKSWSCDSSSKECVTFEESGSTSHWAGYISGYVDCTGTPKFIVAV